MLTADATASPRRWWSHYLRGHLLLFDRRETPALPPRAGVRILLVAGVLELVRIAVLGSLYPQIPLWLLMPALLGFGVLSVWTVAGRWLLQRGFRSWHDWTATEKSYFLQVVVIANIVFPIVLAGAFAGGAPPSIAHTFWQVFLPYFCFGFYQELVYRGLVQLEMVRRWGAPAGILVANLLYTFGPLHWSYFASPGSVAVPMFAAIFAIGLFFGVLYWRSGNLWIVAVFHAIGNAYIVSSMRTGQ